ncbi:hypothetical protein [Pseudorhizobium pelagicum]|uniref:hypothetical protein n=1 Tax=Pseudorhizobium pelagicum TaxID=1509405 RepID=UPI001FDA246D|nr:hypothetical protein [Pseudorhizobium pelagicum]
MQGDTTTNGEPQLSEVEKFILSSSEELAFPPTEWETETLAEVLALPRVVVTRPPEDDLLKIGMRRNDCHANCAAQVANDIEGRSRHVSGWYISGSDLILHSIVEIDGQWFCLTPQIAKASPRFEFIPDPAIECKFPPMARRETHIDPGASFLKRFESIPKGTSKCATVFAH